MVQISATARPKRTALAQPRLVLAADAVDPRPADRHDDVRGDHVREVLPRVLGRAEELHHLRVLAAQEDVVHDGTQDHRGHEDGDDGQQEGPVHCLLPRRARPLAGAVRHIILAMADLAAFLLVAAAEVCPDPARACAGFRDHDLSFRREASRGWRGPRSARLRSSR
jgi:hypothetical protein